MNKQLYKEGVKSENASECTAKKDCRKGEKIYWRKIIKKLSLRVQTASAWRWTAIGAGAEARTKGAMEHQRQHSTMRQPVGPGA